MQIFWYVRRELNEERTTNGKTVSMRTVFTLRAIYLDQFAVVPIKLVLTGITHDIEIRLDRDQTFSLCFAG